MRLRTFFLLAVFAFSLGAPAATPAAPAGLPASAYVSGVVGHKQSYPLSCESRSAVDLAAFWGVSISESAFFNNLPKSDNPDKGFVGDVYGAWGQVPPQPYGVHARPVAKLLRQYGIAAEARYGLSWADLRAEIAAGRPVIVWVVGIVWSGTAQNYTAKDGSVVLVAPYEHTMILIGYDENNVTLVDSGSGNTQTYSVGNFRASWGVLGNMAVTVNGGDSDSGGDDSSSPPPAENNTNTGGGTTYTVQPGDYLTKIAARYGITWQQLAAINNIVWPYTIYAGQKLQTGTQGGGEDDNDSPPEPAPTPKPTKTPAPSSDSGGDSGNSGGNYTVQLGEHLMAIARKLGLNWLDIASLNGLFPPYVLYPGQVLKLPGGGTAGGGGQPAPQPTQAPPPPSGETYTVVRGDYLVALARTFGTTWQELATLNNIGWPYTIYPGQVLKLP